MALKKINLLWLSATLIAGMAIGYLLNAGFCRVSITKRVEKEIGLNQSLRAHFVDLTWWLHTYFIFIPEKQRPISMLPQIHATIDSISEIMGRYYGEATQNALADYAKKQLEDLTLLQASINEGHKDQMVELIKALNNRATTTSKMLNGLNPHIVTRTLEILLHGYIDLYRQDFLAHKEKRDSIQILVDLVTKAREIADLLDDATTQQFPERF